MEYGQKHLNFLSNKFSIDISCFLIFFLVIGTILRSTTVVYAVNEEKELPSGVSYEEIGSQIEAFVDEHRETTAAMEVAIFDSTTLIYKGNFGYMDVQGEISADDDSVFEWGSATKTLVWISVMQLWEQGKIDLNADIRSYLPEVYLENLNYEEPVTMIHLMNHNAGYQDMITDLFLKDASKVLDLGDQLKLHKPEQIYEPGTVTAYSNWGVALAAYIIEQISGQSFDEYVRNNIFEKLGMEHTAIRPDLSDNEWVRKQREMVQCYTKDGETMGSCLYAIGLYPVGMCTSTLMDFQKYTQAMLSQEAGVLFEKEDTWQEMFTATSYYGDTDIPRNCHGFWTEEYGVSVIGHGGNTAGFSSYLRLDLRSGIGMVVMTNQYNEEVFNNDMPELIFGSFSDSGYFASNKKLVDGFFHSARTIKKGPLSLYSIGFSRMPESEREKFWNYNNQNGIEKVSYAYTDLLKLPVKEYIPMVLLGILSTIGVIYAAFTCIIDGCIIRPITRYRRRKQGLIVNKSALTSWNYIACGMILLWAVNLVIIVYQLAIYAPSNHYRWQFGLCAVLGIGMIGSLLWLILRWNKEQISTRKKVLYIVTSLFLVVMIIDILYWNMYQFWGI